MFSSAAYCRVTMAAITLCGSLAVPFSSHADEGPSLTLYSGQHEQSVNLLVADFLKRTGIAVKVHSGEGPEIANQIAEEGASSPADVYFTENSPELMLLSDKGLLAPVDPNTLTEVPAGTTLRRAIGSECWPVRMCLPSIPP